jgi:hypothetical protein
LDASSMADIIGGISKRSTMCGTSCGSKPSISITNCNGDCRTREGVYVVCIGPSKQYWKYC